MSEHDDRFRELLALHLREKMLEEKLSLDGVTKRLGLTGRTYVFRASVGLGGDDGEPEKYRVSVPENLHRLLNFLELEPRDFASKNTKSRWGDLADVVLRLEGISKQQRIQLLDVVNAFLQNSVRV